MSTAATAFLDALRSEIGYVECLGHAHSNGNHTRFAKEAGHGDGQPWCATFVAAVARRVGLELPSYNAYTPTMAAAFGKVGRWHTKDGQPGDVVFFDFPGDGVNRISHVGVVESRESSGSYITIEGNTGLASDRNGGRVMRRTRGAALIAGFGRPEFAAAAPCAAHTTTLPLALEDLPVFKDDSDRICFFVLWCYRELLGPGRKPENLQILAWWMDEVRTQGAAQVYDAIQSTPEGQAYAAKLAAAL